MQFGQLRRNDRKARPLDVGGQMMLWIHTLSPFCIPIAP